MPLIATVRTLNTLIRTCRDGEAVCRAWSGAAHSADLSELLRRRRQEWAHHADELQALVLLFGRRPARAGTVGGRLRAAWVAVKAVLLGRSDLPVVLEWERVHRRALGRYQQALSGSLPEQVRRALMLQASRLSAHHHLLEDLRGHLAPLSH